MIVLHLIEYLLLYAVIGAAGMMCMMERCNWEQRSPTKKEMQAVSIVSAIVASLLAVQFTS